VGEGSFSNLWICNCKDSSMLFSSSFFIVCGSYERGKGVRTGNVEFEVRTSKTVSECESPSQDYWIQYDRLYEIFLRREGKRASCYLREYKAVVW
jgi:hypothetical protein